jgi:DNA-binding transcriptional regulator YiaG
VTNVLTKEPQFIRENGKPMYAIIAYHDFAKAFKQKPNVPHEVIKIAVENDWNMIKAWRLHLSISQTEMANRMGITQSGFSQIENGKP